MSHAPPLKGKMLELQQKCIFFYKRKVTTKLGRAASKPNQYCEGGGQTHQTSWAHTLLKIAGGTKTAPEHPLLDPEVTIHGKSRNVAPTRLQQPVTRIDLFIVSGERGNRLTTLGMNGHPLRSTESATFDRGSVPALVRAVTHIKSMQNLALYSSLDCRVIFELH